MDDGSLENAVKNAGDAIDVLERAALAHNAVVTFFSQNNLDQICSWIQGYPALATEYLNEQGKLERVVVREKMVIDDQKLVTYGLTHHAKKNPGKRRRFEKRLNKAYAEGWAGKLVASNPKNYQKMRQRKPIMKNTSEGVKLCPPITSHIERISVSALHTILGNCSQQMSAEKLL